jgi:small subunit ribosomal protein S1
MLCCVLQAGAVAVSDRQAAQQLAVQQLLSEKKIKAGDLIDGVVTSVREYGVFVDVGGGATGLLHISHISHDRVTSVAQFFAVRAIEPGA